MATTKEKQALYDARYHTRKCLEQAKIRPGTRWRLGMRLRVILSSYDGNCQLEKLRELHSEIRRQETLYAEQLAE